MIMYEQDQWHRKSDNDKKLREMKLKAGKENDVITFNAINLYERSGKDVTVLIKEIKRLYDEVKELHEENAKLSTRGLF